MKITDACYKGGCVIWNMNVWDQGGMQAAGLQYLGSILLITEGLLLYFWETTGKSGGC
jgi:hypothetical protein